MTPGRDRLAEIMATLERRYCLATSGTGPGKPEYVWATVHREDVQWLVAELARVTAERDRLREAVQNVAIGYCAMHDKPNVPRYDPEIEFCAVCLARAALAPEGP